MKLGRKLKRGLAIGAGVAGVGALAYGASKFMKRKGRGAVRRSTTSKLKSQVQKLALKIKKKQLQRKLFKEEMRL